LNLYIVGVGQFFDDADEQLDTAQTSDARIYRRAVTLRSGLRIATGFGRSEANNASISINNHGAALNRIARHMLSAQAILRNDQQVLLTGTVTRVNISAEFLRLTLVE
jgi:hypothetical protein